MVCFWHYQPIRDSSLLHEFKLRQPVEKYLLPPRDSGLQARLLVFLALTGREDDDDGEDDHDNGAISKLI